MDRTKRRELKKEIIKKRRRGNLTYFTSISTLHFHGNWPLLSTLNHPLEFSKKEKREYIIWTFLLSLSGALNPTGKVRILRRLPLQSFQRRRISSQRNNLVTGALGFCFEETMKCSNSEREQLNATSYAIVPLTIIDRYVLMNEILTRYCLSYSK